MESFHFGGVHKAKRAKKTNNKHNSLFHLGKFLNFFRVMELLVVLMLIFRLSFNLPEAVKNSSEYFRSLKITVLSPRFVFVLGNLIVITLFAKSRQFSGKDSDSQPKTDFYSEFIEKSQRLNHRARPIVESLSSIHEKEAILEKRKASKAVNSPLPTLGVIKPAYQRSRSEKLSPRQDEKPERELRRSVTEKRMESSEKLMIEGPFPEDSMSNEEFRQTIEAFIARQQRLLRDEEYYTMS
ncbi:hypothetical protein SAY86_014443 [Trapa natans]|uniref:DUF4408 domain-containing protein n=1 Tax=Trapa natans TaxID=22666 RepID=A0AAN7QQW9_TRANT|nr:hypothetical protein SAY86_014443 [Trapa natans]